MRIRALLVAAVLALSLALIAEAQVGPRGPGGGGAAGRLRAENRTYTFSDTKEEMPYVLFVSSKVTKDKKAPLIVALHGLGGGPSVLGGLALAEEGGYIVVGPMGYNSGGWYGIPSFGGAMKGRGKTPAPTSTAAPAKGDGAATSTASTSTGGAAPKASPFGKGMGMMGGAKGGTAVTDDAKVRELSEKDVMNVLDLVRKEFNVDEKRIYLMGHSMGGAGTLYLGQKYASTWAAIAAIAPAAFSLRPNILDNMKSMPVMIVQGDADTLVAPAGSRRWADEMKSRGMTYEYREIAGADHGSVINAAMPEVYKFFGQHTKP
jgi:poly(3-hydroxybutyrate) depolymerase